MTSYALLFTLAAIGISETVYLIRKRIASEKPICPIGGGCFLVLTSKYNKIFFIHNDVLGLLFYAIASFISGFIVIGVGGRLRSGIPFSNFRSRSRRSRPYFSLISSGA